MATISCYSITVRYPRSKECINHACIILAENLLKLIMECPLSVEHYFYGIVQPQDVVQIEISLRNKKKIVNNYMNFNHFTCYYRVNILPCTLFDCRLFNNGPHKNCTKLFYYFGILRKFRSVVWTPKTTLVCVVYKK